MDDKFHGLATWLSTVQGEGVLTGSYPILTCDEARAFEADFFAGDEAREWLAMQAAGRAVADAVARDFAEIGEWPEMGRVLVLAGKGHNAGDALIAATALKARFPRVSVDVVFVSGERALRPLAARAWRDLTPLVDRVLARSGAWAPSYDLCLDGVFGFQFRAPLTSEAAGVLARANALPVRLRAAVDLPSGGGGSGAFWADFTYATGCVKTPLLELPNAGRVRYLDLGFFSEERDEGRPLRGLGPAVLDSIRGLRPSRSDKRSFGHVLVVAGSRRYPGAALMATLAALRGGAGLVTAAVPESLVAAFAAQVPEAIWIGLPETPEGGGLALEGLGVVREAFGRATAVVLGPGLGRERESLVLAAEVVRSCPHPLAIDADALQPEIVSAGSCRRVLTPHAGEFERISSAIPVGAVVVRKGPVTRIETAGESGKAVGPIHHSFFGGPVLARGGSGDLLAGLIGVQLAQTPGDVLGAAMRGVVWQGLAADALARARGTQAVRTTDLLDFLGPVLRGSGA